MGVDIKVIKLINRFLLKNISVDFTFLNLVNKQNLYLRLKKRKNLNRYDKFNINFYNKVQNGFLKLADQKIKSYQIVNSNLDIKLNEKLILKKIEELIF
jgi:dTMP kinase